MTYPTPLGGDRVPSNAMVLGAAGLLPFLVGAVLAVFAPVVWGVRVERVVVGYGAVILSFLGGMHWGLASAALSHSPHDRDAAKVIGLSVLPSLTGWVALFLPHPAGPLLLAAAFTLVLFLDRYVGRLGFAPRWWMSLRLRLTTGVVVLLLVLVAVAETTDGVP